MEIHEICGYVSVYWDIFAKWIQILGRLKTFIEYIVLFEQLRPVYTQRERGKRRV